MPEIEPAQEIGGERLFATPEMGRAGNLDQHAVGAIWCGPWTVAGAPLRQLPQRSSILRRLRHGGDKARHEGERIRQWHSRSKTGNGCGRVDRGEKTPPGNIGDRRKRGLVSWRGGTFLLREAQSVDRPARQPE